jgi:murein DD-endopeptidase MepM/ murein hydrolase activator NlpD
MRRPLYRRAYALAVVATGTVTALLAGMGPSHAADDTVGTVHSGAPLNVRAAATTDSAQLGWLAHGSRVRILCQVDGQLQPGWVRTTSRWNKIAEGRYVSDAFVRRAADRPVPLCAAPTDLLALPVVAGDWVQPLADVPVGSGFRTKARPEHDGVDLGAPHNTPIRSISAGKVVTVTCNTSNGSCDVDGSPAVRGCGWYVEVLHAGGVVSRYCHLVRRPEVTVGQQLAVGQVLGFVGSSGNSSGPHLHFEVHSGYPATSRNAADPVGFMRRVGAPID